MERRKDMTTMFGKTIINYCEKHSISNIEKILEGSQVKTLDEFKDGYNFYSIIDSHIISENVIEMFDDPMIGRKIAHEMYELGALNPILKFILQVSKGPQFVYKAVVKDTPKFNTYTDVSIEDLTKDSATIKTKIIYPEYVKYNHCEYEWGVYEAIPKIWDLPLADVKHTKCMKEGDEYEEFKIKWENPDNFFKSIYNYTLKPIVNFFDYRRVMEENYREIQKRLEEVEEAKAKEERAKNRLIKFVPKWVVEQCIEKDKNPELAVWKENKSLFFSDIRDFTTISGRLKDEVSTFLNIYFDKMIHVISDNNGEINKFMGDGLMAVFDNPYDGVNAAIKSHRKLWDVNDCLKEKKLLDLAGIDLIKIGTGVGFGEVDQGVIGSEERLDYTVIGEEVNLTSRLEGLTKSYKVPVLIDEGASNKIKEMGYLNAREVHKKVSLKELTKDIAQLKNLELMYEQVIEEGSLFTREIGLVVPKGQEEPVRISEVMNSYPPEILLLKLISQKTYQKALNLYECRELYETNEGLDYSKEIPLNLIKESLEEAKEIFRRIDDSFKIHHRNLVEANKMAGLRKIESRSEEGDYICQRKKETIDYVLKDMETRPEHYEKNPWKGIEIFDVK